MAGDGQCLVEARDRSYALRSGPVALSGDHDRVSPGERTADRVERPPTHDQDLAHGEATEPGEVVAIAPRLVAVGTDDAVGAHRGDRHERASGYYRAPWRWEAIRGNQQWVGIFQSSDDPLIPVAEARVVAAQLRASYFEFADRGHFVDRGPFPELVAFVRKKLAEG